MLDSAGFSGGGFIESRPEEGFVDPAFRSFGMFNFNPVAFGGYLGQHHAAFDIGDDGGTCGRFGPHIDGLLGIDDDRISGSDHSLVDPAGVIFKIRNLDPVPFFFNNHQRVTLKELHGYLIIC
jgi:hypothetical protein